MRKLQIVFFLVFFISVPSFSSVNYYVSSGLVINIPDDVIDEISAAIKTGNSGKLAGFFNSTLDISVPGNEGTFSKTQAELIIKDFFAKNPVKSFSVRQQGASGEGSRFAIGTYTSSNGKSFRTYFLLKKFSNAFLITLLEFEIE